MDHLKDLELVEWACGRLPPERAASAASHMAGCGLCRARADAFVRTAETLGRWQVDASGRDIWPATEAVLRRGGRSAPARRTGWFAAGLRAAAAVLLAAVIGHVAGRLARPVIMAIRAGPDAAAARDAAARELHLDVLASESPVGFVNGALPVLLPADAGEDQP